MPHSYTKKELTSYFFEALDRFNDCLDSDINIRNVHIGFFNSQNGIEVYEKFCKMHFPHMLNEQYRVPGYFESIGAQAFLNDKEYGVLIREDIDLPLGELFQMFLHEIAHLFCTRNEIEGGSFFDKYCMGFGSEDGMMNAGYAIWRETVADIMADSIISMYPTVTFAAVKNIIESYYNELSIVNPSSKKAMSLIIAFVMISGEVACTNDWNAAERAIKAQISINDPLLTALLEQVFNKLHRSPFWEITPDFIITLGETYLSMLAHKMLRTNLG